MRRGFNSWSGYYQETTLGKFSHQCASITTLYNLVPAKWLQCSVTGNVMVSLLSHWPCNTDLMVYRIFCGRAKNKLGGSCLCYYAYFEMITVKNGVLDFWGRQRTKLEAPTDIPHWHSS